MTLFPSGYSLLACKLLPRYIEWLTSCSASKMEILKSKLGGDNSNIFYLLVRLGVGWTERWCILYPETCQLATAFCLLSEFLWGWLSVREVCLDGPVVLGMFFSCASAESSHCEGTRADSAQRDESPTQRPPTACHTDSTTLALRVEVVRVLGAIDQRDHEAGNLLLASCGLCNTRARLLN